MFGYVRPLVGQLLVAENEFFRSLYCGLCRALGRHTGCASSLTLSYDFVFLVAFRGALQGISFSHGSHRCAVHPLKKRAMADDNEIFAYAAEAAAVLNAAKLRDDIADESGAKRLRARLLSPAAHHIEKRAKNVAGLSETIRTHLTRLSQLEAEGCPSLDRTAEAFGDLLAEVTAYGLAGEDARIAREVGRTVGRYIYVIDAADDAPADAKAGRYNPILRLYGDREADRPLMTLRTGWDRSGRKEEKIRLAEDVADTLYVAALNDLARLGNAIEAIDFSRCQPETAGIVKNIVYLGMPAELRRVLAVENYQERTL